MIIKVFVNIVVTCCSALLFELVGKIGAFLVPNTNCMKSFPVVDVAELPQIRHLSYPIPL